MCGSGREEKKLKKWWIHTYKNFNTLKSKRIELLGSSTTSQLPNLIIVFTLSFIQVLFWFGVITRCSQLTLLKFEFVEINKLLENQK
jgi:hypothetical protein